jgi:predicted RNase H-like HicB family nuclease
VSAPEGEADMMLSAYIQATMRRATYEILPDDEGYYGEIPGLQGVYSNADTLEECRDELQSVLEEWLLLRLHDHLDIPAIDGIQLAVQDAA